MLAQDVPSRFHRCGLRAHGFGEVESEGPVAAYMHYQGRAVEVSGWIAKGRRVPRLFPGDQGEQPGDYAVIDDEMVCWDGGRWIEAPNAHPLIRLVS